MYLKNTFEVVIKLNVAIIKRSLKMQVNKILKENFESTKG